MALERLVALGGDEELRRFLQHFAEALRNAEVDPKELLLALRRIPREHRRQAFPPAPSPVRYEQLSLDDVERLVRDPASTKPQLLELTKRRFGTSVGTLRRLTREALADRILAMVRNERSHEAIERLASADPRRRIAKETASSEAYPAQGAAGQRDRERAVEHGRPPHASPGERSAEQESDFSTRIRRPPHGTD